MTRVTSKHHLSDAKTNHEGKYETQLESPK